MNSSAIKGAFDAGKFIFSGFIDSGSSPLGLLGLTAQIVSAHVGNNKVATEELPGLIQQVYHALNGSSAGRAAGARARPAAPAERPKPAVPISKSVFNEYIVCLEDGKKLKMLKRHLQTAYGMTPEQYRAKWGLDSNYPMVAPEYAKKRSSLAKAIGLGTRPRDAEATRLRPVRAAPASAARPDRAGWRPSNPARDENALAIASAPSRHAQPPDRRSRSRRRPRGSSASASNGQAWPTSATEFALNVPSRQS